MPKDHWYVRAKGRGWNFEADFREIGEYIMGINVYFAAMQGEWLSRFGEAAVRQIRRNILQGGISGHALHPVTIALKGHGRPLVDTGTMVSTVGWKVKGNQVEIGWSDPRAAFAAYVADNGATIPVSDGIRRLFAAVGYPLKASTTVLVVSPRPIARDVQEQMHESGAWDQVMEQASVAASKKAGTVQYF